MTHQPFEKDEQQFLRSVGLDRNDLEHLVDEAEELPDGMQARIVERARQKIAAAAAVPAPATAPSTPLRTRKPAASRPWRWVASAAALVASVLALVIFLPDLGKGNLAQAMEQALKSLNSYHAIVEVQWLHPNEEPYSIEQSEMWVDGDNYAWVGNGGRQEFYSDADYRWSVDHYTKEVHVSPNLEGRQLRDRLAVEERGRWVLNNPYKVVGPETVAGRAATKLDVTSPEGYTHSVWIDNETHLPLQVKEWWGRDQIRLVRYVSMEVNPSISPSRFVFAPPAGYAVNKSEADWVADLTEAFQLSGLSPVTPTELPKRVIAGKEYPFVAMVYENGTVSIRKASTGSFRYAESLGRADGNLMGIGREGESLVWNKGDIQIDVLGTSRESALAIARLFASEITLADPSEDLLSRAAKTEPVDPAKAKALQEFADYRGGPEMDRQDPIEASYTFLMEKLGGSPVMHERLSTTEMTISANTGIQAIVEVPAGPYARLYLKRLAPNKAGVWMVQGYDPR